MKHGNDVPVAAANRLSGYNSSFRATACDCVIKRSPQSIADGRSVESFRKPAKKIDQSLQICKNYHAYAPV